MKKIISIFTFALLILLPAQGSETKKKIENFTLEDYKGNRHSLTDYKTSKVIVLMFIATQCPISNAYNERMVQLDKDYSQKGVVFIGINSNKQESVEEIKEHASRNGFGFIVLKDHKNVIADRLGASVTPEIFVLNNNFEILYHGRIDDSKNPEKVNSEDLRNALDAVLAGKDVEKSETKAFGCTIKRVN